MASANEGASGSPGDAPGAVAAVSPASTVPRPALALLALLVFSLAFQGSRGLSEPDEGRYAVVAAQMLRSGDFICPALNDDVPHFTKPPLTYWAIAGGATVLGRNGWGARLAHALAYAATVLLVYAMARTISPERPCLAPLIYSMFPFPFAAANIVTTDTLLTLWEAVAVLGFVRWRAAAAAGGAWRLLMWGGFGLAFLTKGPPGLLPLLAMVVFVWLADGGCRALRLVSVSGLAVFALIGLGWYVLVITRYNHLARYFVEDEVVRRVATDSFGRNPEWYKPFVVYLPVLLGGTLPWTLTLGRAASRSVAQAWRSGAGWRSALGRDGWGAFLALWFWLPCVVLCFSRSRMYLYVLPLFMPLALMAGRIVGARQPWLLRRQVVVAWLVLLVVLRWGAAVYPYRKDSRLLARTIADAAGGAPSTVLFVDGRPAWAVGFYLGSQVKETTSLVLLAKGDRSAVLPAAQGAGGKPGVLLVVPTEHLPKFTAALERLGCQARTLAESGSRSIVAPVAARTAAAALSCDVRRQPRQGRCGPSAPLAPGPA